VDKDGFAGVYVLGVWAVDIGYYYKKVVIS